MTPSDMVSLIFGILITSAIVFGMVLFFQK
jgi:hypothetical protein